MRTLVAVLLFLAIPTFAVAQQASDALEATPVVELQQSTSPTSVDVTPPSPTTQLDAVDADLQVEAQATQANEAAAMQQGPDRQWWYLVGAIVVGGLILAVLL
jgi:hypothetical protein